MTHCACSHYTALLLSAAPTRTHLRSARVESVGFQWPDRGSPIAFIDCTGEEQRTARSSNSTAGGSYQNTQEAMVVANVVQQLLSGPHAMQPGDIGIITPYSGQVCSMGCDHV